MLTYTERASRYADLSNDNSTANIAMGNSLMYGEESRIASMKPWFFLERTFYLSSVADQGTYNLGVGIQRVVSVYVIVDNFKATPKKISSAQDWARVTSPTDTSSTYPEYYFVNEGTIEFWPRLADTVANNIVLKCIIAVKNPSKPDYTTGTASIANAGTVVTGSGTTFAVGMIGNYIKFTGTNSGGGDELWYPITGFTSTTSITIGRPYEGATITGASYIIGQASVLPPGFDEIPMYKALVHYYGGVQSDPSKYQLYTSLYDRGIVDMTRAFSLRTGDVAIDSTDDIPLNPNNAPRY